MSELQHYGTPRHSGRYPWGSGNDPGQSGNSLLGRIDELKKQGLTEKQIADHLGYSTTELRAKKTIAKNEKRKADQAMANRLKEKGMSNTAIGERMGINESSVRALLNPEAQAKTQVLDSTADTLKAQVAEKKYVDIGVGVERHMGISDTKLKASVALLKEEGYKVYHVKVEQLGTGNYTSVKVLVPPNTPYSELYKNRDQIKQITSFSDDRGLTFYGLEPPKIIDSKRIHVRYGEEGGASKDGTIEVRRGVDDLSLGNSRYAQVRIAVDGTHYLKGMAHYSDDLPHGVDLVFNTNKSKTDNKLDAMKPLKDDADNPFGSIVRQRHYLDKDGKSQLSAMNIVNEEGDWADWSRTLSSQVLSKQSPLLARRQLGFLQQQKQDSLDEIMALTNPVVKKKLLEAFAGEADSASAHLKAAALPRQRNHVILPIDSLKPTEVYAPNYKNGERVVLIRHPHGGIFEIPELTVNNKHPKAKSIIGDAIDAVGIHSKVAEQLSGADFDGDTVLVIPNNHKSIKNSAPLAGLKDFDPKARYPMYEGMQVLSEKGKQKAMGDISNLITDMTIRGANHEEIARAVRHSMVVIDAEKHKLNYRQSAIDNGIAGLKAKYQGSPRGGASTLISRASSEKRVLARKPRPMSEGGPIDPKTGKKVFVNTGDSWTDKSGKVVYKTLKSTKMLETDDAHSLSSGTVIESIYGNHANALKAMANTARKEAYRTQGITYSPSANKLHAEEVASLKSKLNIALKNAPLERQAQVLANSVYKAKLQANPSMEPDSKKKVKSQALTEARHRTGANKAIINITDGEWKAIQAGAISNNMLNDVLTNADLKRVKELATPRTTLTMTSSKTARAKAMKSAGYSRSEIADALGVSVSMLDRSLK